MIQSCRVGSGESNTHNESLVNEISQPRFRHAQHLSRSHSWSVHCDCV